MGFFCEVPLYVAAGFLMAYLLQEENGERSTFFTEFLGLRVVLVGSSMVSAVSQCAVQLLSALYQGSGSRGLLGPASASPRKCRFPKPHPVQIY